MAESDEVQGQGEPSQGDDRELLLARHRKEAKELKGTFLVPCICNLVDHICRLLQLATCTCTSLASQTNQPQRGSLSVSRTGKEGSGDSR